MFKLEKFYKEGFNPQQFWDDKYAGEHIAGSSSEEFIKQGFWPLMKKQFKEGGKYLDAGCGIGGWIIFLKEQKIDVEGIDIAKRTVRALTEYDPSLKVKAASMTNIPYPDQSFDGVLAIGTLEYIEDKVVDALQEVSRILKPDGFIFLEVPAENIIRRIVYVPLKRIEKLVRKILGQRGVFSNYLFGRQDIKSMLRKSGFDMIEMQAHELPEKNSHYGLYIDFPFLRGKEAYQLNSLGIIIKNIFNAMSPWIASTGMVVVARKKK